MSRVSPYIVAWVWRPHPGRGLGLTLGCGWDGGRFADKGKMAGLSCIFQDTDFMLDAPRRSAVLSGEGALNSDAHKGG